MGRISIYLFRLCELVGWRMSILLIFMINKRESRLPVVLASSLLRLDFKRPNNTAYWPFHLLTTHPT